MAYFVQILWRAGAINPLTIVISTYLQEHGLPLILHSLAVQSRKDFNVIVYHDGPSIASALICREFKDSLNIKYLYLPERKDDFGYSQRVESLKIVETPYIYWTSGDNYVVPDFVKMAMGAIEKDSLDFVYWDFLNRYSNCNGDYSDRKLPWNVMDVTPQQNRIDISSFIVNTEKARGVEFDLSNPRFADGKFVTDLLLTPTLKYAKIPAVLSVHC